MLPKYYEVLVLLLELKSMEGNTIISDHHAFTHTCAVLILL